MCMRALPTGMSVLHVHAYGSQRPEEGTGFPGTGVTEGCDLGPLGEQTMLLPTEPNLQLHQNSFEGHTA